MGSTFSVGVEVIGDGLADDGGKAAAVGRLAARLEDAGVSYWVIGAGRGEVNEVASVSLEPSLLATIAARHSTRLGLVIAAAPHRDHPYNLARRLVSADHAARGRVGWLALDFDHSIALNAATDTWTGTDLDADHTSDAIAAVRALWRTWPLDSVVGDLDSGVFADVTRIRRANVRNRYQITGPLNVPGSVQGDLPVWRQAGPDADGGGADLLIVEDGDPIPTGVGVVIRLRSPDRVEAVLAGSSGWPSVAGILLRLAPAELDHVLEHVLPAAREKGLPGDPAAGTLRERLGLALPERPDLSGNPTVFDTVPNPGGRL